MIGGIGVNCCKPTLAHGLLCDPFIGNDLSNALDKQRCAADIRAFCYCNNQPQWQGRGHGGGTESEVDAGDVAPEMARCWRCDSNHWRRDGTWIPSQDPLCSNFLLPYVESWIKGGITAIGGCCGSTSEHIAQIQDLILKTGCHDRHVAQHLPKRLQNTYQWNT